MGAANALPHTPPPPSLACAQPTPLVGRGAMGSHLRVVRPGGPSRPRERLGRFRNREGSQGAPRQAPGRHTEPSGSVWRPDRLAPSHRYPAVAGAQAFGESPSKGSRPPSTHAVGVGLGPFKGVFAGQYGLIFPNLKGTNSGSWKPALQAQLLRPVGAWISEQARRRANAMSCGDAPHRGEWENPSKSPDVIRGSWDVLTASQKLLVDPGEPY